MTEIKPITTNINRVGKTDDGKAIYEIKENDDIKRITIPEEKADTYEKLASNIDKKFGKYNDNPTELLRLGHMFTMGGAIIGSGISAYLLRKTPSTTKKVLGTMGGAIAGSIIAAGTLAGLLITKMIGVIKETQKLGIENYKTPQQEPKTDNKETI